MGKTIKYLLLALLVCGLGWKVYSALTTKAPEAVEVERLEIGDPESQIDHFYGTATAVSGKSGGKTYYFGNVEIDVSNLYVSAIRHTGSAGVLDLGSKKIMVDQASEIREETK